MAVARKRSAIFRAIIVAMDKIQALSSGLVYDPSDDEIMELQKPRQAMLAAYNSLDPADFPAREEALRAMFASFGAGSYIEIPFRANWAGKFVSVGEGVYANFNLTLVDDAPISIGDKTLIGPNVTITTATHPVSPGLRMKAMQYNKPVTIGRNVFIGAGSVICPGVSIGDNSVIGAGSVVVKDIPANVVAFGNPCQVRREITGWDDTHYDGGKEMRFAW